MNENMKKQLEELITGVGALTELWVLTYKNLLNQGLDAKTAAVHTKMVVETIFAIGNMGNGGK